MPAEIHDSRGAPVLPRLITHMGDGSTPLTNRDMTADILACRQALEALSGNPSYTSRSLYRADGCSYSYLDEGTPIAAGNSVTLLNVSGWGGLRDLYVTMAEAASWVRALVLLDGVYALTQTGRPADLAAITFQCGLYLSAQPYQDTGIYQGIEKLTSPERARVVIHLGKDGYGRFSSSCQVQIQNFHATDSRKVSTMLFYTLGASVQFNEPKAMEINPAEVRLEIANRLTMAEDDVTVAQEWNWNDELRANVPSVITLVHRKSLSPAAETEVKTVMAQLKAPESGK